MILPPEKGLNDMKRKIPRTTKYWQPYGDVYCPECGRRAQLYHKGTGQRTQELLICKNGHTLHRTETHWQAVDLEAISPGLAKKHDNMMAYDETKIQATGPTHSFLPRELSNYYWDQQDERLGLNEK